MFDLSKHCGKIIHLVHDRDYSFGITFTDGSAFTVTERSPEGNFSACFLTARAARLVGRVFNAWTTNTPRVFTQNEGTCYGFDLLVDNGFSLNVTFCVPRKDYTPNFCCHEEPAPDPMWIPEEGLDGPFVISHSPFPGNYAGNIFGGCSYITADEALTAAFLAGYRHKSIHFVRKGEDIPHTADVFIRKMTWQDREWLKLAGKAPYAGYTPLPWTLGPISDHFAHYSRKNPALVAFTESDDKGERDIQTPMRPGRYLKRYYPELNDKEVLRLAEWFTTGLLPAPIGLSKLDFATTPEAIASIYAEGPESCMSGEARSFGEGDVLSRHPASVYGAGDLAVAYMMNGGKVIARAVVWPSARTYGRAYPTLDRWKTDGFASWEDADAHKRAFLDALAGAGYSRDDGTSFIGARLLAVREDKGWLMPYVDGYYGVRYEEGKDALGKRTEVFVLCPRGETSYDLTNTDGIMVEPYVPWWWEDMDDDVEDDDHGREDDDNLEEIAA